MKILDASYLLSVKDFNVLEAICNFHFKKFLLKPEALESEVCKKPVVPDENSVYILSRAKCA